MVLIMLNRPSGLWPSPRHEDKLRSDKDMMGDAETQASDNNLLAA